MEEKEKYFFEAFDGMSRLAPGSRESTLKALAMSGLSNGPLKILDAGCGNGVHTLLLAEAFPDAHITAIDNYLSFIEKLMVYFPRRRLGSILRSASEKYQYDEKQIFQKHCGNGSNC